MDVMRSREVVVSVLRESQQGVSFSVDRPNLFVFRIAIKASAMRRECNPSCIWRPIWLSCSERRGCEALYISTLRVHKLDGTNNPITPNTGECKLAVKRVLS